MDTGNVTKAQHHFDFLKKVMSEAAKKDMSIDELFGYGEADFIVNLYPYSHILQDELDTLHQDSASTIEKELSVILDELARCFWESIEHQHTGPKTANLPDVEEFNLHVQRLLLPYRQDLH